VKQPKTIASVLLAAGLAAAPALALAQTQMTDTDAATLYVRSSAHLDMETQHLTSLTNQVPQKNVVAVPVDAFALSPAQHRALRNAMTDGRRSALMAALAKVTVATEDRPNGESEDQESLLGYIKHLGIDPHGVVAVDVNTTRDPQNPYVTVFYRKHALKGQQQGGPG